MSCSTCKQRIQRFNSILLKHGRPLSPVSDLVSVEEFIRNRAFSNLLFFTLSSHWLFGVSSFVLIGCCNNVAFGLRYSMAKCTESRLTVSANFERLTSCRVVAFFPWYKSGDCASCARQFTEENRVFCQNEFGRGWRIIELIDQMRSVRFFQREERCRFKKQISFIVLRCSVLPWLRESTENYV